MINCRQCSQTCDNLNYYKKKNYKIDKTKQNKSYLINVEIDENSGKLDSIIL